MHTEHAFAHIPMKSIGPIKIIGQTINTEVSVPLASFEIPIWPSTNRGAKVSRLAGGITTTLVSEGMTRSIVLEAPSAAAAHHVVTQLQTRFDELATVARGDSQFATLEDMHSQIVGKLLFLRFALHTGDASGHNMVTKAADALLAWIMGQYRALRHISVSGNFCVDKKVSAVNGILGRGKYVVAEITVPRSVCQDVLKTTPEKIVELNLKKNLIGSTLAGSTRTANAHFANLLLATYLATGQDAANIVEGSQGLVHTEMSQDALYFSVTLPNLIVGCVGNGKHHAFVQDNLAQLGCLDNTVEPGDNARRLAMIIAATVLCGELSLLAAQTNPGELMRAHIDFERNGQTSAERTTSPATQEEPSCS